MLSPSATDLKLQLSKNVVLASAVTISLVVYCAGFAAKSNADSLSMLAAVDSGIAIRVNTTSRQTILSYIAPDALPCTVDVSESSSYTPVINDLNPGLFAGGNLDNRAGALGAGTTSRTFVVGTIPDTKGALSNLALDGKRYGRALTPATTYFARVTCGSQSGIVNWSTNNRPVGMTRGDEMPLASAGNYAFPTINSSDRSQTVTDPVTGIVLRKMTIPSEDTIGGGISFYGSGAAWPFAQSTITDSSGTPGYLATMPTDGGSTRLYFVTDTASRFLGTIILGNGTLTGIGTTYFSVSGGSHFGANPTQLFGFAGDANNDAHVIRCQLPASGNSYYNTTIGPGTWASCTWTDMTPNPNNLSALMLAFDPTYDKTKFGSLANSVVQGNYLLFRWCGIHAMHPALGTNKMSFTAKTMYEGGVGKGQYTVTLNGAMTNSQTTITFSSNTPTSPNADTTLYDIAGGDEINVDSEVMYLGSFVSGTTWNIAARGQA